MSRQSMKQRGAAKAALRYIPGTIFRQTDAPVKGYCDADYAEDLDTEDQALALSSYCMEGPSAGAASCIQQSTIEAGYMAPA